MSDWLEIIKNNAPYHPVVPFDPAKDKLLLLSFTEENAELSEEVIADTLRFTTYINTTLQAHQATYGIGGYAENRTVYSRSPLFDALEEADPSYEPRRLHLGIDIWGKPLTPVMAPVEGIVHSFGFHSSFGNYGGVIILSHRLQGCTFYTLYGHLSLNSIRNVKEGNRIAQGDVFAEMGIPQENGSWPPHLHFQIIKDMEGQKGDYPGVCRSSEREKYLANCPDPDVLLQMMAYAVAF